MRQGFQPPTDESNKPISPAKLDSCIRIGICVSLSTIFRKTVTILTFFQRPVHTLGDFEAYLDWALENSF